MNTLKTNRFFRRELFILPIIALINLNVYSTDYYVSNSGKDDNDGTSVSTPWLTVDKVNSADLKPGDRVLFEAGGTWRETLDITHSGSSDNFIIYTRYGSGANPQILGSDKATDWTSSGTLNVWQSAMQFENLSEEYYPGRIFFLENDSVCWGHFKTSIGDLNQEFDYTIIGLTYYVYSSTDPDIRYNSIEVTQRSRCMRMIDNDPQNYIEVDGIDFKFSRLAGFDAGYPEIKGFHDLVFRNCTIGYIGAQPSGYAYGIAAWHSNFLVENCTITDCGRRGVSVNLYVGNKPAGEEVRLKNIIIRNNVFKRGYHTTSLDLSLQQSTTDEIKDIYYYNNIVDDSEFDVICEDCTSNQVFFQNGSGASTLDNIYVVGNLLIQSTARNILFEGAKTSYVWNNTIIGNNPNITVNPYANVVWNADDAECYYRNNILYDNLPDNSIQNHGVFIWESYSTVFKEKDYNLYYSLFPKTDRNFSAHRVNSVGGMGYWNTNDWVNYRSENTQFEIHSPIPTNPKFINYDKKDFRLIDTSPAIGTGLATPWIIIKDPLGIVDTINKCDINGKKFDELSWDMGAFALASSTGVDPLPVSSKRSFSIYPNPASHFCMLAADTAIAGAYYFHLYDIQGKLIYKSKSYTQKEPVYISLEQIPAGLYFVRFFNLASYAGSKRLILIK
jgi:hypothetical protein